MQVAILTAAAGLLAAALIPGGENSNYAGRMEETHRRMMKIEEATTGYMATYGHRPCPADATIDIGAANFGREAANSGTCTGGTPATNLTDAGSNAVAGGVPNVTLGLTDDYAFDGFGHRITYVVDKRSTAKGSCIGLQGGEKASPGYNGDIEIYDNSGGTLVSQSMWLLLSHGMDAHGGFPMEGQGTAGGGSLSNRINTNNTDTDTLENASVDGSFTASFNNIFIKKERTDSFDDLAWTSESSKNTCCLGSVCRPTGFRIDGTVSNEEAARSLATGDVNDDGIDDIIIGGKDVFYVVFGSDAGFPNPLPLNSLDGTNGYKVNIAAYGTTGWTIRAADLNNDGAVDVVTNANLGNSYAGQVFIVFGRKCGGKQPTACNASYTYDASTLNGVNGVEIDGGIWGAEQIVLGEAMAVGDVNNDTIPDLILNSPHNSPNGKTNAGSVFVIYGKPSGWANIPDIRTAVDGINIIQIDGDIANSDLGGGYNRSASGINVADINNDLKNDLIITSNDAWYVLFGRSGGWTTSSAPTLLNASVLDGTQGVKLDGSGISWIGTNYVEVGDFNHDTIADMAISNSAFSGQVFIIFGTATGWTTTASTTLNNAFFDGIKGVQFNSVLSFSNTGLVLSKGDVNHDGIDDLGISAPAAGTNGKTSNGAVYVIYGKQTGWPATATDLTSTYLNGINGLEFDGDINGIRAGQGLAFADVDSDGKKDIIISAQYASRNNTNTGSTYVIFGKSKSAWSATNDVGDLTQ